jgi:hypothetical protein
MADRQPRGRRLLVVPAVAFALVVAACAAQNGPAPAPLTEPPSGGWEQPRVQLTGMGPAQLDKLLGPPQFKRNDGPAHLMQYRNDACVLDVFVYENRDTGEARVEHVEARDYGLREMSETACLSALLRTRKASAAS